MATLSDGTEIETCFDTLTVHPFPLDPGVLFVTLHLYVYADIHGHQRLGIYGELPARRWRRRALMLHVRAAVEAFLADEMR